MGGSQGRAGQGKPTSMTRTTTPAANSASRPGATATYLSRSATAPTVAAADGCRGGWIGLCRSGSGEVQAQLCSSAAELVVAMRQRPDPAQVLLIDMPIGLPEQGQRRCDREARQRLGVRRNSIFPAPIRPVLAASSWSEACTIREGIEGKRLSQQSWNITAKVREVDQLLAEQPQLRGWLREVHPELSFSVLAGAPLDAPKRTAAGKAQRQQLVAAVFGAEAFAAVRQQWRRSLVADDDILDAFAALWSAERLLAGTATVLPEPSARECDGLGLAMEIVV